MNQRPGMPPAKVMVTVYAMMVVLIVAAAMESVRAHRAHHAAVEAAYSQLWGSPR